MLSPGTLVLEGDRIVDVVPGTRPASAGVRYLDLQHHYIVPGFIDVHLHGVEGTDTLDGPGAVAAIASRLPKYGVTAFCPTTVACSPAALRQTLVAVTNRRGESAPGGARVLPAHLESNFLNPDFRGAQPQRCLRLPPRGDVQNASSGDHHGDDEYDGADIVREIERGRAAIGIVTLAPEIDGALELVRRLVSRGLRVGLGHSGATFDAANAAISLGARHATHLFNRMPPLGHRDPGLVGAVLTNDAIAAELICDGVHVHPAMLRVAIAAKHPERVIAITDGTAATGLPEGSHAALGGHRISVARSAAYLDDGTLAGSVASMSRVFQVLVTQVGTSLTDAAKLCATSAAAELDLQGLGSIAPGALADLVVLDRQLAVKQTYIAGRPVYSVL